jgi:ferredoxin
VVIDTSLCAGHGRCYKTAPGIFEDDDRGYGQVKADGQFSEEYRAVAERARIACPERAIEVID